MTLRFLALNVPPSGFGVVRLRSLHACEYLTGDLTGSSFRLQS